MNVLKKYESDLKELIKTQKNIIIPDFTINIDNSILFLERFCHLNGLGKVSELIFKKYETQINELFINPLEL